MINYNNPMRSIFAAVATAALLLSTSHASAQTFLPGNLIVSSYGGAGQVDGQSTAIVLNDFSLSGTTSASLVSATTLSGIVGENGSSSEGTLQLTGDGQYLTIMGYNPTQAANGIQASTNTANGTSFTPGTAYSKATVALAQSTSSDVSREADVIDANGNVVSTTSFSTLYTVNNPRSAYSANGSTIYVSGQGDKTVPTTQGIYYVAAGTVNNSTPATIIYNTKDTRTVDAYAGNLYYSTDKSGSPTGIFKYNGLPTSAGQATTQITPASNGLTGTSKVSYSPEGFYFANANTLYVADTGIPKVGGTGAGGIQKWTLNGSAWTLQYVLAPSNFVSSTASSGETGFEAITGQVIGGTVNLYAVSYTAADGGANGLYGITDTLSATTGAGETFTELASTPGIGAGSGLTFKGVSFAPQIVPEPSTWALMIGGLAMLFVGIRRRNRA